MEGVKENNRIQSEKMIFNMFNKSNKNSPRPRQVARHRTCTAGSALLLPGVSGIERKFRMISSQHKRSLPWLVLLEL